MATLARRLGFGLARELWLVQLGIFVNNLGRGAVLPFEVIYLHNGRGFSLSVAGLVVGTISGVAVVAAPLAGPLIDRCGARAITAGAGMALARGYAGLAFAIGECFHSAALSPLVADLAPASLRGRYMASIGLSWWVGLALAPTVGTQLLSISPLVALLAAAAAATVAAGSILRLERRLPAAYRLTPRPDGVAAARQARLRR